MQQHKPKKLYVYTRDEDELVASSLLQGLTELQNSADCSLGDVLYWLSSNCNQLYRLIFKYEGRELSPSSSYKKIEINKYGANVYAMVSADWAYESTMGTPIDLHALSKYFGVLTCGSMSYKLNHFKTQFSFNLEEWPKLVPSLIYAKLLDADQVESDERAKRQTENEIAHLLEKFYPHIRPDIFEVRRGLGMFESYSACQDWFSRNLVRSNCITCSLPDDITP